MTADDASPLEKLLVDRVVAGWLALIYAEANYHQNLPRGLSWEDSEYMQRRIDRAHRRYLSALNGSRVITLPAYFAAVALRARHICRPDLRDRGVALSKGIS